MENIIIIGSFHRWFYLTLTLCKSLVTSSPTSALKKKAKNIFLKIIRNSLVYISSYAD